MVTVPILKMTFWLCGTNPSSLKDQSSGRELVSPNWRRAQTSLRVLNASSPCWVQVIRTAAPVGYRLRGSDNRCFCSPGHLFASQLAGCPNQTAKRAYARRKYRVIWHSKMLASQHFMLKSTPLAAVHLKIPDTQGASQFTARAMKCGQS